MKKPDSINFVKIPANLKGINWKKKIVLSKKITFLIAVVAAIPVLLEIIISFHYAGRAVTDFKQHLSQPPFGSLLGFFMIVLVFIIILVILNGIFQNRKRK